MRYLILLSPSPAFSSAILYIVIFLTIAFSSTVLYTSMYLAFLFYCFLLYSIRVCILLFFSIAFSSGGLTVLYCTFYCIILQLKIFLFLLLSPLYLAFPFYCILLNFLLSFSCLLLSLPQFMLCFLFNVSSSISSIPFNFC